VSLNRLIDLGDEFFCKHGFAESQRIGSAVFCGALVCWDSGDGVGDGFGGGLVEERAGGLVRCGWIVDNRVQSPPSPAGDDGAPGGLGLDRGDAEVFDLGEEESVGLLIFGEELRIGQVPEELDQ